MIKIAVYRDAQGRLTGFDVRGHSGWAARGSDIVCAGVAALTQSAVLGLVHHVGVDPSVEADDGRLACRLCRPEAGASTGATGTTASPRQEAAVQAVLATMVLGLQEIARQYPEHVQLREHSDPEDRGG